MLTLSIPRQARPEERDIAVIVAARGPAGRGIVDAEINGAGHLILFMTDNTTIDAGLVVGGTPAPSTAGQPIGLLLTLTRAS